MDIKSTKVKLGDVADAQFGMVLTRKADKTMTSPYQYRTIQGKSIKDGEILKEELSLFYSVEEIDPSFITKKDDILFKVTDPFDAVMVKAEEEGLLVAANYIIIRTHTEKVLPRYVSWYLNERRTRHRLNAMTQGTSIIAIRIADLLDLSIELPPLDIQEKIVKFLELADEEIRLLERLIQEKARLYKHIPNQMLRGTKK